MATADLAELRDAARTMFEADATLKRAGRTLLFGVPAEVVSRRPFVSMNIISQEDQADFGTPHTDHVVNFVMASKNPVDSELLVLAREFYRVFHEKTFTFGVSGAGLFFHIGLAESPHLEDGAFEMTAQYMLGVTWG